MLGRDAVEALRRWNAWEKPLDAGIERRDYLDLLPLRSDVIVLLEGPRRAGKTYIARQVINRLIEEGVPPKNTLFVNFEDPQLYCRSGRELLELFDIYRNYLQPDENEKIFMVLDEVQEVQDWSRAVYVLREQGVKIFITGSSGSIRKKQLSRQLIGRYMHFFILPLSFGEYLLFKGLRIEREYDFVKHRGEVEQLFEEYLQFGGFPEVAFMDKKEEKLLWLQDRFEDLLRKDILARTPARKPFAVIKLARYLLSHTGVPFTFTALERQLGGELSNDSIKKYIEEFSDAFLLKVLRQLWPKMKEQVRSPRKPYAFDTGLVHAVAFRIYEIKGRLLENLVLLELLRRKLRNSAIELFYWKDPASGKEVDFVVKEGERVTELVQVCWNLEDESTWQRERDALFSASKKLKCSNLTIVTAGDFPSRRGRQDDIKILSFSEFSILSG